MILFRVARLIDFGFTAYPHVDDLRDGLVDALTDFGFGQRAKRMLNRDPVQILHTESVALRLRFQREFLGDDHCGRDAFGFQGHCVMHTARRAGASVADCGEDDIVVRDDFIDQRGCGIQ